MEWHRIEDGGEVFYWRAMPSQTIERDPVTGRRTRRHGIMIALEREPAATRHGFGYVLAEGVDVTEAHVREGLRIWRAHREGRPFRA